MAPWYRGILVSWHDGITWLHGGAKAVRGSPVSIRAPSPLSPHLTPLELASRCTVALSFVPNSFIGSINGFVTCWSSVFLAFYFLRTTRTPHDLLPVPSAPPDEEGLGGPTTVYHEAVGSSEGLDGTWAASGSGSHVVQTEPPRLGQESAKAFRHTPA